ncbi:MAG: Mth938-like domain-containing protein [Pseudomonadota bacterium]
MQPLLDEADRYDFVLLGCGATIAPPPAGLRALLKSAGLGVEFMDTGAACRVYNVLLTEQRRFAGAFIAV